MRKGGLFLLAAIVVVFGCFSLSQGQCPEDPNDNGECDTLNVICLDCEQAGTGPYNVRFPILITHDQPAPVDSIRGFIIPLTFTHTNPAAYCSVNSYWNGTEMGWWYPAFSRSVFRHMFETDYPDTSGELYRNRMALLEADFSNRGWDFVQLTLDDTANFWLTLVPISAENQAWWESERELLATMTLRVQDTMHVCIDSTFWPPASQFSFSRSDAISYIPRHNLPRCFWIGNPQIRITSPNGGEAWVVGDTHDITWVSENFYGEYVDIEFSADGGSNWTAIVEDTPNDGIHPWLIPDTVSATCLVKVSDAEDGDPYDQSDDLFSIIYTAYFEMDAEPDTQWVKEGDSTQYSVILTSLYGFSSSCTLSIEGLPAQTTFSFDPPVVIPTDTSILTVVTDTLTPLGTYELLIIGTEQTKQFVDSTTVMLFVTSSFNRKPELTLPGPQVVYGGLQIAFPVVAVDADSVDTLTLTKSGVGEFPCYPRVSPVVCYFQWTTTPDDTLNSPYTVVFNVDDGRDSTDIDSVEITVLPYDVLPSTMPGDVNGDGIIDISDGVFLLNYLFQGGPPPNPPAAGDINGDCFIGLSDIIWLLNYLYRGGSPPQIRCLPGDFNYDGYVDILDPPYFINYMAYGGPGPVSMRSTDVNADCFINTVDLVYEIKYLLRGGAAPEPGCVEPKGELAPSLPPGIAKVSFSSTRYDHASRVNLIPVLASFDDPVAGVELVVTFNPEQVSLLPPTLTYRTADMDLYYHLERGKLSVGLLDLEAVNYIQPGSGAILDLHFVPVDPGSVDASSIQIEKATFVDPNAQELLESIVK
jgi:hypothetical protein